MKLIIGIVLVCLLVLSWLSLGSFAQHELKAGLTEGWVDDDTYRFIAVGIGRRRSKNAAEAADTACRAAILSAQYKAIEKLGHAGSSLVSGYVNFTTTTSSIVKELSGIIRGGAIVNKTYDPLSNVCTVVYEIKESGLKEKVRRAAQKALTK